MLIDQDETITGVSAHPRSTPQLNKVLTVEWLGQTAASLCWIGSVLAYGIASTGDWLQLCAASAWLVANLAAIKTTDAD